MLLVNIACLAAKDTKLRGKKLQWDTKNMKITNHEEADKSMFMRRLNPRDHLNWI